jgi:hypothetical protein
MNIEKEIKEARRMVRSAVEIEYNAKMENLKKENEAMHEWLTAIHKQQGWSDLGEFLKQLKKPKLSSLAPFI